MDGPFRTRPSATLGDGDLDRVRGRCAKGRNPLDEIEERFAGCRDRQRAIESSAAARPAETTDLINEIHVLQVAAGVARRFLDVRSDEARAPSTP